MGLPMSRHRRKARQAWREESSSESSVKNLTVGALTVKQLTEKGQREFSCGNYAAAVGIFSAAINQDEGNSNLYALRSAAWAKKGDLEKALEDARMTAYLNSTSRAAVFSCCWSGGHRHVAALEVESVSDNSPLSNKSKDETASVKIHDPEEEKPIWPIWHKAGCGLRSVARIVLLRRRRTPRVNKPLSFETFSEMAEDSGLEDLPKEEQQQPQKAVEDTTGDEDALDEEIFNYSRRRRSLSSLCSIPEEELL